MALVAAAPTVLVDNFNIFEAIGTITVSGSYVNNGVTFDLTPLGVASNSLPICAEIFELPTSGVVASGYTYRYALGTTIANGVIQAFASGGTQAAVATFASLSIANLGYRIVYKKFV